MTEPSPPLPRATAIARRASLALVLALLPFAAANPHGNEARLVEFLDWKPSPRIARSFGANRAHLEGVSARTSALKSAR
jgi:hypothetical protein